MNPDDPVKHKDAERLPERTTVAAMSVMTAVIVVSLIVSVYVFMVLIGVVQ